MSAFVRKLFGLEPPEGPAGEGFRAATIGFVWVPLAALAVTVVARALSSGGPAPPTGLRLFAIALLATVIWLVRLPAPRVVRLLAVPAMLIDLAVWIV